MAHIIKFEDFVYWKKELSSVIRVLARRNLIESDRVEYTRYKRIIEAKLELIKGNNTEDNTTQKTLKRK